MNDKVENNRHNLQPETLQDLQESLYDWQTYNFGEQATEITLLGICEEAGELCHAQLKLEQGIRGTTEEHEAEILDAIGDIMIYVLNYMSGLDEKISAIAPRGSVRVTENQDLIRASVFTVFRKVSCLEGERGSLSSVQHIIMTLGHLSALKGWDLEYIVRKTWAKIGQRDWKRFPETGLAPATGQQVVEVPAQETPPQTPPA